MTYFIIAITSLFASLLTFFSGFGLGTILLPLFALFFPLPIAVALTAIVHLLNNLFKLALVGKHINFKIALRFGIPSVIAALGGAWLLREISQPIILARYELNGKLFHITLINVVLATLMIFFALYEIIPYFKKLTFGKDKLVIGGLLSGFFGGLSGHQGALRSAFLIRYNLSKESFIATGVIIACSVDIVRLIVYGTAFNMALLRENANILLVAILFAFSGAYAGSKLVKKVTLNFVQLLVSILLIVIAVLLGAGIITK
jgi:uncharacterized protein